jgi:hypothetical protein
LRTARLSRAAEALTKGNQRWQRALRPGVDAFRLVHGRSAGAPRIRLGFEPALPAAARRWYERAVGHALARAVLFVPADQRPVLLGQPWASDIILPPPRFGGDYRGLLPDELAAMPIDGVLWRAVRDDIQVTDAVRDLGRLVQALARDGDPLRPLVAGALVREGKLHPPAGWQDGPFAVARLLARETAALAWRGLLAPKGDDPGAVLLAEALTVELAPPVQLPPEVRAGIEKEERGWKDRATPPGRAVQAWAEGWIAKLPEEILEAAWHESLLEEAQTATMRALARVDKAIETGDPAGLWGAPEDGPGPLLLRVLENIDPTAHGEILHRRKEEGGRFKGKARRLAGAQHLAKVAVSAAFDHWLRSLLDETMEVVEVQVLEAGALQEEAARGALYGFTAAEGLLPVPMIDRGAASAGESKLATEAEVAEAEPVVPATPQAGSHAAPIGHLFADLKGFTALTANLREVEVRQFLRSSFYEPLLRLAKEYFKGGSDLADRGGIRLNNLLGDALSLSGEPLDLLEFAERATALVRDEGRELMSKRRMAGTLRAGEDQRIRLEAEASELRQRAARGSLDEAARRRQAEIAEALSALSLVRDEGPELDFGFFVSFGAPPVELSIDDDVFGKVFVALAEKINESARGVERSGAVGEAIEGAVAALGGHPPAFRVHIGPAIAGSMPPALFEAWPTDPEEVDAVAQTLRSMVTFSGGTALYNGGIGLSGETAAAILAGETTVWRGKREALTEILPGRSILEPRQHFVRVTGRDGGARLLRFCGRVQMKGFREPPPIWEWLGPYFDGFDRLLAFVESDGRRVPAVQAIVV